MKKIYTLGLFLSLAACSESNFKGSVQAEKAKAAEAAPPVKTATAKPDPVKAADAIPAGPVDCTSADSSKILTSDPQLLNFAAHTTTCTFGVAPNLAPKNGSLTAREISSKSITLPKGTVCGMILKTDTKELFKYDDMLVMTLDKTNVLFASTENLVAPKNGLVAKSNVFQWDWEAIKGHNLNFEGTPYCLNKKLCTIPNTDREGPIDVAFEMEDFAPITSSIFDKNTVDLDLIVMGDDDADTDCTHRALNVNVSFKYIAP